MYKSCSFYTDLVKLSTGYNGKIPSSIDSHYVKFCWIRHRESKGLKAPQLYWHELPPTVIYSH